MLENTATVMPRRFIGHYLQQTICVKTLSHCHGGLQGLGSGPFHVVDLLSGFTRILDLSPIDGDAEILGRCLVMDGK